MKQLDNQAIEAIFVGVCKAYSLTKAKILAKSNGIIPAELAEARVLCTYFLREIGLTYQQVASVMQRTAASSSQKMYEQGKMWLEKDLYKDFSKAYLTISNKLEIPTNTPENTPTDAPTDAPTNEPIQAENKDFEHFDGESEQATNQVGNENIEVTQTQTTNIQEDTLDSELDNMLNSELDTTLDDTPEPLSVTDAPLAQTPITRDLGSHYKPSAEADAISKGADYDNPFADFDNVVTKTANTAKDTKNAAPIIDDSVPAATFEKLPSNTGGSTGGNSSKIIIDDDTANFTTETIVSLLITASTEVCHHYSQIDTETVRKLEKAGEVPNQSVKTAIDINKNAHKTLESTAQTKSEMLKEALKKVVINKNVSVSPETALVFMFLIFAGFMFMTTKQIRQDGIDAIERMRDVKIDNDKNKVGN